VEEPVDSLIIRLNYISLPVLVKISTANKKWYAISGIEAGYLLDSFIKSGDTQEDINADVAQYNIAIHFGAGFRIPFKFGRMFIELRYSQGLVNLTDEPIEKSYVPRVKTSGFKVLIGYEIPLSKKEK
jgi:hypothetical protein